MIVVQQIQTIWKDGQDEESQGDKKEKKNIPEGIIGIEISFISPLKLHLLQALVPAAVTSLTSVRSETTPEYRLSVALPVVYF